MQPCAADWLEHLDAPEWLPTRWPSAEEIAEREATRLGEVEPGEIIALFRWMLEPSAWFDDPRHLAMRHHTFGIFEAEDVFGVTMPTASGLQLPTRYLAERPIRRVLGRNPQASDWLRRIRGQKWMAVA